MENNRTRDDSLGRTPTHHHRTYTRKPKDWNRKCRLCDKDPWPNYFYCYDHLPIITRMAQGKIFPHRINLGYTRSYDV